MSPRKSHFFLASESSYESSWLGQAPPAHEGPLDRERGQQSQGQCRVGVAQLTFLQLPGWASLGELLTISVLHSAFFLCRMGMAAQLGIGWVEVSTALRLGPGIR